MSARCSPRPLARARRPRAGLAERRCFSGRRRSRSLRRSPRPRPPRARAAASAHAATPAATAAPGRRSGACRPPSLPTRRSSPGTRSGAGSFAGRRLLSPEWSARPRVATRRRLLAVAPTLLVAHGRLLSALDSRRARSSSVSAADSAKASRSSRSVRPRSPKSCRNRALVRVQDRRPGGVGAAALLDQTALDERGERPLRRDAAHLGDLGARRGLQVGHHGKRLEQRRREVVGAPGAGEAFDRPPRSRARRESA